MIRVDLRPEDETLANILSNLEFVSSKNLPATAKAFKIASALVQYTWKSYAAGRPIKGSSMRLKNPTGAYKNSIKIRFLSPFNHEIYSDSPIALYLEKGTQEYDMKKTHPYGKQSRIVKKTVKKKGVVVRREGDPYLIIPFRHGVPGTQSFVQKYGDSTVATAMPEQVFQQIERILKTDEDQMSKRIKGRTFDPNFKGELIPRAKYKWGARFKGMGFSQMEGLVAMDTSSPKKKSSQYMTFRVISVNSPAMKWIVKARPAMNITQHVVNNTKEEMKKLITSGVRQDLGI